VTDPLPNALVRSLDVLELRRALAVATQCLIRELQERDGQLSAQLLPLLLDFGVPDEAMPS
jgi:hypothetical protein